MDEHTDLGPVDALVQLSFLVQSVLARIAADHDLSLSQVRLLGVLRDRRPGMLELARLMELEKSSLTGLVDRAQARGLVRRGVDDADRRGVRVELTTSGHEVAGRFAGAATERIAVLLEGLPGPSRSALSALASHVVLREAAARGVDLATERPDEAP